MKRTWEVVVGNVGTVYSGTDGQAATESFLTYISRSQQNDGRAAGEPVTLCLNGEPFREYAGTLAENDQVTR